MAEQDASQDKPVLNPVAAFFVLLLAAGFFKTWILDPADFENALANGLVWVAGLGILPFVCAFIVTLTSKSKTAITLCTWIGVTLLLAGWAIVVFLGFFFHGTPTT